MLAEDPARRSAPPFKLARRGGLRRVLVAAAIAAALLAAVAGIAWFAFSDGSAPNDFQEDFFAIPASVT